MQQALGKQGLELVHHRFMKPGWTRFQVQSQPDLCPQRIVRRMQSYLLDFMRDEMPACVRNTFGIKSCGLVTSATLREVAAAEVEQELDEGENSAVRHYQIQQKIDLSKKQTTHHGEYSYNLHIDLDLDSDQIRNRKNFVELARDHILRFSRQRKDRLLQATVLPKHVDLTLGGRFEASPAEIALDYMNSLADACHHRPVFCFSVYVNTLDH